MKGKVKYILLFVLLLAALFAILSSSLFDIKTIEVRGNKKVEKEEIIKLSNISYGKNIFIINKKNAMKNIFQNTYIKMINIRTSIPNRIIIDIIERDVIALVPYVGSYIYIDEEGIVLEINPAAKQADVPVIKGLKFNDFKIGDVLKVTNPEQLKITTEAVKEIKAAKLIDLIAYIDMSDLNNIKLVARNSTIILMGNSEDMGYKASFAKKILEDTIIKKIKGIIDMSHKGNPVFRSQ